MLRGRRLSRAFYPAFCLPLFPKYRRIVHMNVKKWLRGLCAAVLCVAYVGTAGAAELQKVPTAWMGAQETFPIWYAKQKGWDKEVGLDVELLYFSSGMDALSTLPAKTWVFGGMGAIPALMGALRHDTYVIANCNDEAMVNAVMVRPDSPIMQTKGYNKSYPNVYGTPESVKGKTVLWHDRFLGPLRPELVAQGPWPDRKGRDHQEYGPGVRARRIRIRHRRHRDPVGAPHLRGRKARLESGQHAA